MEGMDLTVEREEDLHLYRRDREQRYRRHTELFRDHHAEKEHANNLTDWTAQTLRI